MRGTVRCRRQLGHPHGGQQYLLLSYDAENRVRQMQKNGAATAAFGYDGDGKLVTATTSGTTTFYVGNYYEKTGSTVRKYYYHGGRRVAMRENGVLSWLLTDQLGSTVMTLTASAGITGELRYKTYGETRYTYGTTSTKYRFTGQREESTIGLYFYNARWYDAALGRFIQADSIVPEPGNPQELNRYTYVLNNPCRHVDPSGNCLPEECPDSEIYLEAHEGFPGTQLSRQQLVFARLWARRFGISFELLAGVLGTQQKYDYDWRDAVEDTLVKGALFGIQNRPATLPTNPEALAGASLVMAGASVANLSLGPGQVKISVAGRLEREPALKALLPQSASSWDVIANLETDRGNTRYAAAYLRELADARMGRQGPHSTDLTTTDMQVIYGAYRAGIGPAYGTEKSFRSATEAGALGKLLSQNALDVYRR